MWPLASATGMNFAGLTAPRFGQSQRNSASSPCSRRVVRFTLGWNTRWKPCWRSASAMSCCSSWYSTSSVCMRSVKNLKLLRPESLAWYMAMSAFFSSRTVSLLSAG